MLEISPRHALAAFCAVALLTLAGIAIKTAEHRPTHFVTADFANGMPTGKRGHKPTLPL